MTQLWKLLAACALAPFVLAAQEPAAPASEHEQHEQHARPPAKTEMEAGGHSMAAMQEHMRAMRQQMDRIHAAESPAERQRLMQEHMQSMQRHMDMMAATRSEEAAANPSRCRDGDAPGLIR
jgi:hypothetical protein